MKTNKKLLASAMALGLAALTTVGSTYAWFTTGGSVEASGVQMKATSGEGLYIATKGDLSYGQTKALDNPYLQLDPCTSANGTAWFAKTGSTSTAFTYTALTDNQKGEYPTVGTSAAYITKNVYTYTFYLAADANTTRIYMKAPTFTFATGENVNSAVRYSIECSEAKDKSTDTAYATKILAAKAGDHLEASKDPALIAWNAVNGSSITTKGSSTVTGWTADTVYNTVVEMSNNDLTIPKASLSTTNPLAGSSLTSTMGYGFATVKINFWLEGNDPLCYNAISGQGFTCKVNFATTAF